jgi:hypothetical protein
MKNPKEWLESDISQLIIDKITENLELDYKACDAIQNIDKKKTEISKDVSSFANSSGGLIIYGVHEKDNLPDSIDKGYDPNIISKEWLEQVINSNIHPKIEGIFINQIPLDSTNPGKVIYVVVIPQATTRAPHQANDKRYYKRYNFQSVAMEDYEVKDVLRRSNTPDLHFILDLLAVENEENAIYLEITVENKSVQPANHVAMTIFIDSKLQIRKSGRFTRLEDNSSEFTKLHFNWSALSMMPIFKEYTFKVTDNPIVLVFPEINSNSNLSDELTFYLGWELAAPGMKNTDFFIVRHRNELSLSED